MKSYTKLVDSPYMGKELEIEVIHLDSYLDGHQFEIRFSRLGQCFIFHGFYYVGDFPTSDEDVVATLCHYLPNEYRVYQDCKSYFEFIDHYGDGISKSTFYDLRNSGQLIAEFFSKEELLSFEFSII